MAVATHVSVEEYLNTTYRPDRDYVDGEVVERNSGEFSHSRSQYLIGLALGPEESKWGIMVLTEQRVHVKPTRFRVPDICVLAPGAPREPITRQPPFLCIEILSKDDSLSSIMERVEEYLAMGVPNVWVVDPLRRRGYHFTSDSMHEAKDGILRTTNPDLAVPLAPLFD